MRGDDVPFPTRTKLVEILERYVEHVRTVKTAKSAQTDVYYLRQMFGPICPAPPAPGSFIRTRRLLGPCVGSTRPAFTKRFAPHRPVMGRLAINCGSPMAKAM